MVYVTILQDHGRIREFNCIGHAEFSERGQDIVCAGVSAIVINTINSLEKFANTKFKVITDPETDSGLIEVTFEEELTPEAVLLMNSMILGLQGIQNEYENKYLRLEIKEV